MLAIAPENPVANEPHMALKIGGIVSTIHAAVRISGKIGLGL